MTIHFNPDPAVERPSRAAIFRAWVYIFLALLIVAVVVGKGVAALQLKYCAGPFNTPKCERDRTKERTYEQTKGN